MVFHIERGVYSDLSLDGLNAIVMARTPGPMIEGNWTVAVYVDERGDDNQGEGKGVHAKQPP